MDGWVKIFRNLINWEWYDDIYVKVVFLHLIITANYEEKIWHGIHIKRGQVLTSRKHLSEDLKLSEQQVRTALKKLEKTKEITINTTNKYTLVTIENYDFYQERGDKATNSLTSNQPATNQQLTSNQPATNQQLTSNQPATNQQLTSNQPATNHNIRKKEIKKEKKERKINKKNIETEIDQIINLKCNDENLKNTIYEFIKMRKAIKKPLTTRGLELMITKLYKLTPNTNEQIEILNNSIMNNWQGIFPLKQENKNSKNGINDFKELWEEARKEDEQNGNNTSNNTFSW